MEQQMKNNAQHLGLKNKGAISDYASAQGRHNTDRMKHLSQSSFQKF